jgi:hypothetical protein
MLMLARTLALLVGGTVALGAASADAASAAYISAKLNVQGAGSVFTIPETAAQTCTQKEPVSQSTVLTCPSSPWEKSAPGPVSMSITAQPMDGWKFARWVGCPSGDTASVCVLAQSNGTGDFDLTARFEDITAPAHVERLRITPTGVARPSHQVLWESSEQGVHWQCSIDGGRLEPCVPRMGLDLPEGKHTVSVVAIDPSGNVSRFANAYYTVVDTLWRSAPADGATLAAPHFVVGSGTATSYECSLDGAPFGRCGASNGELRLPALSDGAHTLKVRGRVDDWVDASPLERKFTLDTRAPHTTLTKIGDTMDFHADDRAASFRCSLDGGAPFVCAPPHPLPHLAPGRHSFEVYATVLVGNGEPKPARVEWDVAAPTPIPTVTPAPTATPAPNTNPAPVTGGAAPAAPAIIAPAVKKQAFKVSYRYRKGRLTKLRVTGIPAGQKLKIRVKCPKRAKACPKSPTTVRKLVGKRLAKRTKITFTAGKARKTIRL